MVFLYRSFLRRRKPALRRALNKEVVLAQPWQAGNAGFYTMIFFHGIMGLALMRQKYEKKQRKVYFTEFILYFIEKYSLILFLRSVISFQKSNRRVLPYIDKYWSNWELG